MKARVVTVMINSEYPEQLVEFWCKLLSVQAHPHSEKTEHIWLFPAQGEDFKLGFQRVKSKSKTSSEIHIDIAVDNLDDFEKLILSLGGKHLKSTKLANGFEWRVFEDPQQNQFCIFPESHS